MKPVLTTRESTDQPSCPTPPNSPTPSYIQELHKTLPESELQNFCIQSRTPIEDMYTINQRYRYNLTTIQSPVTPSTDTFIPPSNSHILQTPKNKDLTPNSSPTKFRNPLIEKN